MRWKLLCPGCRVGADNPAVPAASIREDVVAWGRGTAAALLEYQAQTHCPAHSASASEYVLVLKR